MKKTTFSLLLMNCLNASVSSRFLLSTWLVLVVPTFLVFSGCSTPLVLNYPVGPNPFRVATSDPNGQLEVFTSTEEEETVGFSFPYKQRTAYAVYTKDGKLFKHVGNNSGHYEDTPQAISLPPGAYSIKAFMSEGLNQLTVVTVEIEAGRKTEVHLDGQWSPPDYGNPKQLLRAPNGSIVGWLARSSSNQ